jgi:hypothetical protein
MIEPSTAKAEPSTTDVGQSNGAQLRNDAEEEEKQEHIAVSTTSRHG